MASKSDFVSRATKLLIYLCITVDPAYYDESEDPGDNFIGGSTYNDDDDDLARPSFVSALPLPERSAPLYTEKTLALSVVMTAIFALSLGFLIGFCLSRKYGKGEGGAGSGSSGTASGISGSLYLSNSDLFEAGNAASKRCVRESGSFQVVHVNLRCVTPIF